ncbi:MAG: hypothetical protein JXA25_19770 [Anaerolineales bacterium]|nr:hypothetical protein [Anaerolineales bacterium]
MSTAVTIVWAIFAAVFFYLGYAHWRNAQQTIRPYQMRGTDSGEEVQATNPEVEEYLEGFNKYIDGLNDHFRKHNNASAVGYFVAGITSLISMILFFYL